MLPGPWEGAACPNLSQGCEGKLRAFHTMVSETHGNTYMYRCDKDGVQVVLDFKLATTKQ